jgi:hypothetical protein
MHLHDLLGWEGPMTHRQCNAWNVWLDERINEVNPLHDYLAQIAAEVRRSNQFAKSRDVKTEQFRIKYRKTVQSRRVPGTPLTPEEIQKREVQMAMSKAFWMSMGTTKGPGPETQSPRSREDGGQEAPDGHTMRG